MLDRLWKRFLLLATCDRTSVMNHKDLPAFSGAFWFQTKNDLLTIFGAYATEVLQCPFRHEPNLESAVPIRAVFITSETFARSGRDSLTSISKSLLAHQSHQHTLQLPLNAHLCSIEPQDTWLRSPFSRWFINTEFEQWRSEIPSVASRRIRWDEPNTTIGDQILPSHNHVTAEIENLVPVMHNSIRLRFPLWFHAYQGRYPQSRFGQNTDSCLSIHPDTSFVRYVCFCSSYHAFNSYHRTMTQNLDTCPRPV